ncbi:cupin-like domain-containing protein [Cardinium endosymbiont of Tipula unca]|uniref:cupin-like domain-containing protein n=1 Tax=Cardinium endosymbiont of Tipula unca TaxID=3066216 RepID=UPI0030D3473D
MILAITFYVRQPIWGVAIVGKIPEAPLPITKALFKSKYYDTLRPIIFREAAKTWEAAKWNLDFFTDQYGDTVVSVQLDETLTGEVEGPVKTTYISTTLKKYIQHIKEHGIKAGYLNQWNILSIHPELHTFLQIPAFYESKMLTITNLWLGPKGTKSKLHYDSDHNLFTQIYGRKLVTLISPDQSKKCYPINRTWYDGYSPIDILNPDLEKYPLFADVVMLQAVLEPGDCSTSLKAGGMMFVR